MSIREVSVVLCIITMLFVAATMISKNTESDFKNRGCHQEIRKRMHRGSEREVYVWKCPNDDKEYPSVSLVSPL
jgi:Ni/Co efflux regulator RcnB